MQSRREERERENKTTCGGVGECGCFVRIELLGWLGWAGLGWATGIVYSPKQPLLQAKDGSVSYACHS